MPQKAAWRCFGTVKGTWPDSISTIHVLTCQIHYHLKLQSASRPCIGTTVQNQHMWQTWMVPHMGRASRRGRSTGFWHACVDMPGVAHRASRTEEAAAPGSNACQSRQRELSVALMCGMKVLCCRQSLLPACCNVANGTGDDCAWTHQPLCPQHLRSVLMGIDFQSPS